MNRTLSQTQARVAALYRRYAVELAVVRLRPVALQLRDEMTDAVTGDKRGPAKTLNQAQLSHSPHP